MAGSRVDHSLLGNHSQVSLGRNSRLISLLTDLRMDPVNIVPEYLEHEKKYYNTNIKVHDKISNWKSTAKWETQACIIYRYSIRLVTLPQLVVAE